MPVPIPDVLRHAMAGDETGATWLADLDRRVARAEQRWGLLVGAPFVTGMAAWTAAATTADGTEVVLKLSFPHEEARFEADALRVWRGSGAVALLAADAEDQALLLPRLRPGTTLAEALLPEDQHLAVGIDLLRQLGSVPVPAGPPFAAVADVAAALAATAEERVERLLPSAPYPVDAGLCRRAIDLLRTLPAGATRVGLAHGDLNPGNVLRVDCIAPGEDGAVDWLAIDPKPVHGDLAWDPWPLLTQVGDWLAAGPEATELAERTRRAADQLDLDAARIAAWCTARSVESGLWAADCGWWTGFRGADGDLDRGAAWAAAADLLGG